MLANPMKGIGGEKGDRFTKPYKAKMLANPMKGIVGERGDRFTRPYKGYSFSKLPHIHERSQKRKRGRMLDTPRAAARRGANHLPVELVIEILAKLPVIAISRFRCVCKSWYRIMQKPDFIHRHLQNNKRNSCSLNIIYMSEEDSSLKLSLSYFFKDRYKPNIKVSRPSWTYGMSNSCDGLICVFRRTATFVVNPSTGEVFKLPVSSNDVDMVTSVALVRDSATGEYKVVRMFVAESDGSSRCEIFTLGRNSSSWRYVGISPLMVARIPVVANEIIYWDISDMNIHEPPPKVAISLDWKKETFDFVLHPEGHYMYQSTSIHEVGGYLCFLQNPGSNSWQKNTLWTLEDHKNNRWTKLVMDMETMEDASSVVANANIPLGLRNGKILTSSSKIRFDLYDPVRGCFERPPFYHRHEFATPFIESLISPNGNGG